MKKLFLMMMAIIVATLAANAQSTKVITGAVIDTNGNPLPNAQIQATGGAETVTTDADGTFSIEVPIWLKSLTAQYAGMKAKKVNVENKTGNVIIEMKKIADGGWFADLAYSLSFPDTKSTYNSVGLMGGYLGKWGGYVKALVPVDRFDNEHRPSVTAGVIKSIGSRPIYTYLGVGAANVQHGDGEHYGGSEYGVMFDIGAIFKFRKFNFAVGYSLSADFDYPVNHSAHIAVGYCFF